MDSSTSAGELNLVQQSRQYHKPNSRTRQRDQQRHRLKSDQHSLSRERSMGSNGVPVPLQNLELNSVDKMPLKSPSNKGSRHQKRNLREKRRPTGVHIFNTESTGGTSTDSEDFDQDFELVSRRNAHLNEIFLAAIGADKEQPRDEPDELKVENEQLREQLRLKEEYIKILEQKLLETMTVSDKSAPPTAPTTSTIQSLPQQLEAIAQSSADMTK